MRIVGGRFGGRVINPPRNLRARPTTDFAKENLFNVLGNLIDLEGTEVLDLFSGTGSISYEFISRGAAGVTSVEVNAVHHNFIRRTAAAFGMENLYAVRANAFLYLKSASKRFDVIFSDAPYDLEGSEQVVELDNRFHEILYNASDSKELKHVLLDFHHYVQRVRKITLADPKRSVQSNQEHRQIVEALKKHDAGLAEKLANEHMMNTIHNMDNYGWDNLFQ